MAQQSASGLLYVDAINFLSSLFTRNQDEDHEIFQVLDSSYAEELQFQEAQIASMITSQMTNIDSSITAPSLDQPPAPMKETGESSLIFCELCSERKERNEMLSNKNCAHSFCSDCISKHVLPKTKDGMDIASCLVFDCKHILELDTHRPVTSREVLDNLGKAVCEEMITASEKVYCPFKDCSAMLENSNEAGEVIRECECPVCHRLFCVQCSVPWHPGVECEEFQKLNDDSKVMEKVTTDTKGSPQITCRKESSPKKSSILGRFTARNRYIPSAFKRKNKSDKDDGKWKFSSGKFINRAGSRVTSAGESVGKWKGLKDEIKDHEIVWPPMVVIMNTSLEKDHTDQWTGMRKQYLIDSFSSYNPMKAKHSYGPQGHRGMSILIFEGSARGYLEAELLHKDFAKQGIDRNAWTHSPVYFLPGGQRQLYGYMAVKEDLDIFNRHSPGKSQLKYEMRSYREMVVNQIRKMTEENQQLLWLRNRFTEEQKGTNLYDDSLRIEHEKLRQATKEIDILRQKIKEQLQLHKDELAFQEEFFKEQIKIVNETKDVEEDDYDKSESESEDEFEKALRDPSTIEEQICGAEEIADFVMFNEKEMEEFEAERDKLIKVHKERMIATKQKHWEEEV